jgi:hypothetical protein
MIQQYYDQICAEWGVTPTAATCTGYESVYDQLRALSKQAWTAADDAGREAIQQAAFDIYRSVGIVPITYYSLEGCRQQISDIADSSKTVKSHTLAIGGSAGSAFSRFWFPGMQQAAWGDNNTVGLRARFMHDNKLKRAIKICYKFRDNGEQAVFPAALRTALELVNGGTITNFKPMNARAIWEYICPVWRGRILDFSAGFGGRMMGAMTSRMRYHYTGIDPNTKTFAGLQALGSLINEVCGTDFDAHCIGSEDFVPEPATYDAAFSSPPYFNCERYNDEPTQCYNKFTNLDAWFEQYVEPTLTMIHTALAADAIYAVNIADYKQGKETFSIVDHWKNISAKVGFEYQETVNMLLTTRPGVGNNRAESSTKSEGIYIFRKKCLTL